jgi:hypothetical protein
MRNTSGLKKYEPLFIRFKWTDKLTNKGYGRIRNGERKEYAHRISYKIFIGFLPDNLNVCHKCDNPKCVNPFHLFKGTQYDNVIDMYKKGRWKRKITKP